ncbi:MAG: YraN family protein [Patescibacteria group bacterium]|nr:YraN family protein [Patescibacteria group bacterium]
MGQEKIKIGQLGESLARRYLENQGYIVLAKNIRTKKGELDLICQKNQLVVFVEVKTRRSKTYGLAEEAITHKKALTLAKITQDYLMKNLLENRRFRIDLIVVELDNQSNKVKIRHVENAISDLDDQSLDD